MDFWEIHKSGFCKHDEFHDVLKIFCEKPLQGPSHVQKHVHKILLVHHLSAYDLGGKLCFPRSHGCFPESHEGKTYSKTQTCPFKKSISRDLATGRAGRLRKISGCFPGTTAPLQLRHSCSRKGLTDNIKKNIYNILYI